MPLIGTNRRLRAPAQLRCWRSRRGSLSRAPPHGSSLPCRRHPSRRGVGRKLGCLRARVGSGDACRRRGERFFRNVAHSFASSGQPSDFIDYGRCLSNFSGWMDESARAGKRTGQALGKRFDDFDFDSIRIGRDNAFDARADRDAPRREDVGQVRRRAGDRHGDRPHRHLPDPARGRASSPDHLGSESALT